MQALADCKKDDRLDDSAVEINSDDEFTAEAKACISAVLVSILSVWSCKGGSLQSPKKIARVVFFTVVIGYQAHFLTPYMFSTQKACQLHRPFE